MNRIKQNAEEELIPDEYRCKRSDGKQWRCVARAMENKTLCEKHYNQAKKRGTNPSSSSSSASAMAPSNTSPKKMKINEAKSKSKLKGGHFSSSSSSFGSNDHKFLKDLGVSEHLKFSKRIDDTFKIAKSPTSSSSMKDKVLPYPDNVAHAEKDQQSRICHQCQRNDREEIIRCQKCGKKRYCVQCIARWYPAMSEKDVKQSCPYCRGNCNCKACFCVDGSSASFHDKPQQIGDADKIKSLRYLLSFVQPLLGRLHQEQCQEMEIETKWNGDTGAKTEKLKLMKNEHLYCDNCSSSVIDLFRSCSSCSYNLCITCCYELRCGQQPGGEKASSAKKISYTRVRVFSKTPESESQYKLPDWSVNENESIPCPHPERGGCGSGILALKRILKPDWIAKMVNDVNCIMKIDSKSPLLQDAQDPCYDCSTRLISDMTFTADTHNAYTRHASNRIGGKDNYVYCPTIKLTKKEGLQHFQKHWFQGEPVIVRNVLKGAPGLSWDPLDICHAVEESINDKIEGEIRNVQALDCLNWSQVDINIHQFFKGYQEGRMHKDGWPEMLQLKDWPPSILFQERLARHGAEFFTGLPFHEYTHPKYGSLNLISKLPDYILKPDLGPKTSIAYGMREELGRGDSVTKLHCNLTDVVNVLVHATAIKLSEGQKRQLDKILELYREVNTSDNRDKHDNDRPVPPHETVDLEREICGEIDSAYDTAKIALSREHANLRNDSEVPNVGVTEDFTLREKNITNSLAHEMTTDREGTEYEQSNRNVGDYYGGALWDIFRRQDLPNLLDYLQKNFREFQHVSQQGLQHVTHSIHDLTVYLTQEHKRKLKEKYGVDPWTFEQHVGEAVFIPAGCAYQVRNLKSCIHVEMDFVSPENLRECIRLTEEVRLLPSHHHAKEDKLEVKKMMLYAANKAIKDVTHLLSVGSDHLSGLSGSKHSDRISLRLSQQRREYVLG